MNDRDRPAKIIAVQTGPSPGSKEETIGRNLELLDEAAKEKPDFVVFPELSAMPYFPTGEKDKRYFDWAEPVPGPLTKSFGQKAAAYGCYIILPLFEKGLVEGVYYNSAVVLGPEGEIVYGMLPEGDQVKAYRKNHLGLVNMNGFKVNEPFYMMRPGTGYPVFQTSKAKIGILICYDRWFPESWRSVMLNGAELVFVPVASCYGASGGGGDILPWSFRIWAHENLIFAVACNRAGIERFGGRAVTYYGLSCIVDPGGKIVSIGPENKGPALVSATIDLAEVSRMRKQMPYLRDRRPEIYRVC